MAGFPHHQLEGYLGKLIAAGYRAAVCDQVEDPKLAKGLVRREVTRVVTPGTITDDTLLNPRQSNYLASVTAGDPVGLAWVELSTGRFVAAGFPRGELPDQLARIGPSECLVAESADPLPGRLAEQMMLTRRRLGLPQATTEQTCNIWHRRFRGLDSRAGINRRQRRGRSRQGRRQKLTRTHRPARTYPPGCWDRRVGKRRHRITRDREPREGSLLAILDRGHRHGLQLLADWVANYVD